MSDISRLRALMVEARPQVIFHLASTVTGVRSVEVVLPTLRDNLIAFVNLAVAAAELGGLRIVAMGSLQEPDQTLPAVPNSPYAAAKYAASCYARMFGEVFALPIAVARTYMVYGPGQTDFSKLIPYVVSQLLHGCRAELSSGRQLFDWIHVDDVADALIAIAATLDANGHTVDVGTGVLTSVADVARLVARHLGLPQLLRFGAITDRRGEPVRQADIDATRRLVGWTPGIDLQGGLAQTVDWYRQHSGGLPAIGAR